ncbi:hypothetical protein E1B28_008222 [Marasmius oreades]|uniref:Extracellular membrane protein CFEM domain-containing protein n=1 Tax=Marasmius oreades TaxID=181124 RepID=A0A9P7UU26_9AGAR|nr:uncharacterized protein E1B28_008222 [Marasmius oreades]KAG7091819.1 hypothetical protein E1B28_008222 [Marasmius oreades]
MFGTKTLLFQSILATVVLAVGVRSRNQVEARDALSDFTPPTQCASACGKVTSSLKACTAGDPSCRCEDLTGNTLATCLECAQAHNPDATVHNPGDLTDTFTACQTRILRKGGGGSVSVDVGGALSIRPNVLGAIGIAVAGSVFL